MGRLKINFWNGYLLISLFFHLAAACFSLGHHQPDEHFQILEFATIKLPFSSGTEADLPWEYAVQIRSAIQPAIVTIIAKTLYFLGLYNPFLTVSVLQLFSALLGWGSLAFFSKETLPWMTTRNGKKLLIVFTFLLWFFPYLHARFSSESFSGTVFFIGVALLLRLQRRGRAQTGNWQLLGVGILLGLAFLVRYQTGVMLVGLYLWLLFICKSDIKTYAVISAGAFGAIFAGICIDRWFYGEWILTAWNYFIAGVGNARGSLFPAQPWWSYFVWINQQVLPPFSIIILAGIVYAWIRYPRTILTWIFLPFLIAHFLIGHKELRFLFPLVNGIPTLLALTFDDLSRRLRFNWLYPIVGTGMLLVNVTILFHASFHPINNRISLYKYVWREYSNDSSNPLILFFVGNLNPYSAYNPINFYKPPNINVFPLSFSERDSAWDSSFCPGQYLVVVHDAFKEKVSELPASKIVFRENSWTLYEINCKQ